MTAPVATVESTHARRSAALLLGFLHLGYWASLLPIGIMSVMGLAARGQGTSLETDAALFGLAAYLLLALLAPIAGWVLFAKRLHGKAVLLQVLPVAAALVVGGLTAGVLYLLR